MFEITLTNVIENLKSKYSLSPYQAKQLSKLIHAWQKDDYIYPGHVKSKAAIDIKIVYNILEDFKHQGYIEIIYEIYCNKCSKSKGKFINTLTDLNEDVCCDFCNKSLNTLDDVIALYKVIREGE